MDSNEVFGLGGFGNASDSNKLDLTLDNGTAAAFTDKQIEITGPDAKGQSVALASNLSGSDLLSSQALAAGVYFQDITCEDVKKYDDCSFMVGLLAS